MNQMQDTKGAPVENAVMGRPFVVVALSKLRFKVTVMSHCRSRAEAEWLVDQYTNDPASIEYVIVEAHQLREGLERLRADMATSLGKALGVG